MRSEKLKSIHVVTTNDGDEFYTVGGNNVTAIEWSVISGHMADLDTVQVFVGGELHSEHPFCNCLSVYFAKGGNDEA